VSESNSPFMQADRGGFWGRYLDQAVRSLYAEGAPFYRQGDQSDTFYFLTAGRVRIYIARSDGSEKTVAIMEPGTAFGESACYDELPHFASAVALRPCEVYQFHRDTALQAMSKDPLLLRAVLQAQIRKQRLLSMQVEDMTFLKVRVRVAHTLGRLANEYGEPEPDGRGRRLTFRLTQEELASILGTSRVTISREISALVRQGILAKDKWDLIVLDEDRLRQIALGLD